MYYINELGLLICFGIRFEFFSFVLISECYGLEILIGLVEYYFDFFVIYLMFCFEELCYINM